LAQALDGCSGRLGTAIRGALFTPWRFRNNNFGVAARDLLSVV
jgi:hypothetical protein